MREHALEVGALFALFAAVTGLAALLGAANLGTAATFGQVAFLLGVLYVITRRGPGRRAS